MSAVTLANPNSSGPMGGRIGTASATLADLLAKLGEPTHDWRDDPVDEKVSIVWVFHTPRGKAEIRDYWWNAEGEWSIAAERRNAALWLARFLRKKGIPASTKAYRLTDVRVFA